jgi:hypothetical protein
MTQEMRYELARDSRGEKRLLGLAYASVALIFVENLVSPWIPADREWSKLVPTLGTTACVILCIAVGTFHSKLQATRRRIAELDGKAGKNPQPPTDPAKTDEKLRKLHISRLE